MMLSSDYIGGILYFSTTFYSLCNVFVTNVTTFLSRNVTLKAEFLVKVAVLEGYVTRNDFLMDVLDWFRRTQLSRP